MCNLALIFILILIKDFDVRQSKSLLLRLKNKLQVNKIKRKEIPILSTKEILISKGKHKLADYLDLQDQMIARDATISKLK